MLTKIIFSFLLFSSLFACKVTEQKMAGTYRLRGESQTRLVLHPDKRFEFVKSFEQPGPEFLPDSTEHNFRTSGNWELSGNDVLLTSFPAPSGPLPPSERDSIVPNTTITSFSFWNRWGNPVPIRLMKFPNDRIKLYKDNSISFFAGDFSKTDTLEFHFYGYRPIKWPGRFPRNMADNFSHHITLYEDYRSGYFNSLPLKASRKKLVSNEEGFVLFREKQ